MHTFHNTIITCDFRIFRTFLKNYYVFSRNLFITIAYFKSNLLECPPSIYLYLKIRLVSLSAMLLINSFNA
mgnify:CR=1 FL=1